MDLDQLLSGLDHGEMALDDLLDVAPGLGLLDDLRGLDQFVQYLSNFIHFFHSPSRR
jgi:hypothetical protein